MERDAVAYWSRRAARRVTWVVACTALAGAVTLPAASAAETKIKSKVPFEELVTLNAVELFGTKKVTLKGDRVKIVIGNGHMARAFKGKNIYDSKHPEMVGSNRGFFMKGDAIIPGFCALGKGRGVWTSRFPIAGETNVQFNLRIPNPLGRASDFRLRINSRNGNAFETIFFNSIARVKRGKPTGRVTSSIKKFRGVPTRWFPRNAEDGVKIEFGIDKDGVFTRFDKKEIVRLKPGKIFKDTGGEVVFSFNRILFTLQHLKISGLLDREWATEALAELEKKGKLREKHPAPKKTAGAPKPEEEGEEKPDPDDDVEL